jgi:hypothetical protein
MSENSESYQIIEQESNSLHKRESADSLMKKVLNVGVKRKKYRTKVVWMACAVGAFILVIAICLINTGDSKEKDEKSYDGNQIYIGVKQKTI